jgi:hypothetical protein
MPHGFRCAKRPCFASDRRNHLSHNCTPACVVGQAVSPVNPVTLSQTRDPGDKAATESRKPSFRPPLKRSGDPQISPTRLSFPRMSVLPFSTALLVIGHIIRACDWTKLTKNTLAQCGEKLLFVNLRLENPMVSIWKQRFCHYVISKQYFSRISADHEASSYCFQGCYAIDL